MRNKLRNKPWYPYAVAACIAVAFYVLLAHMGSITNGILTFLGYFKTIFLGCIIAYVMNPLARMLQHSVFKRIKQDKLQWYLSIAAAVILLLALIGFLLRILIPQLMNSLVILVSNMDSYLDSFEVLMQRWLQSDSLQLDRIFNSSEGIVKRIQDYFLLNADSFFRSSAEAGKSFVTWVIAFVLSVYMLASKESIKRECKRLLSALMSENKYVEMTRFLSRCDRILVRYIVSSLADAAIVGIANALFMTAAGMEYAGLISVVVAVTNLIPTFGPIIGGAVGVLILLLVKPVHALVFIIFTFVLQFIDPYFIKPKLFGNTLGISGLLILMSVIICGNLFGVFGLLIAIPLAAIVDFVYKEGILVLLERKKAEREASA